MLVIQPPVIFSIFTQHLIRIFALEVLATRFDISMAGQLGGLSMYLRHPALSAA
jgi:hypothetical protein